MKAHIEQIIHGLCDIQYCPGVENERCSVKRLKERKEKRNGGMLKIESYGGSTLFSFVFLCLFGAFFDSGTLVSLFFASFGGGAGFFFVWVFFLAVCAAYFYGKG